MGRAEKLTSWQSVSKKREREREREREGVRETERE
jgi:hypothetical protein